MSNSEYEALRNDMKNLDNKVDRILNWAKGDQDLGTPSVAQRIDSNAKTISETRKLAFDTREELSLAKKDVEENKDDIKSQKREASILGGGSGGIVWLLIEAIKTMIKG